MTHPEDRPTQEEELKVCMEHARNMRKVKIKKPTVLQTILRNRYQKRSIYYFTCGRSIRRDLLENDRGKKSPFHTPKEMDDFTYRSKHREDHDAFRRREKLYKSWNRPSFRSRLQQGRLERLHIPEGPLALPGKSIVEDIDPEFFTTVSGRPIRESFDVREYLKDLQDLFLLRLQTGYRYDETYLMEEQYREERRRLLEIQAKFEVYAECYEQFLAEDHSSSIELLHLADLEVKISKTKREKIRQLLRDCGWYRTKILVLDEQWRTSKVFQRFLYQVAPLSWRREFDYIHRIPSTGMIDTSDTSIFGRYRIGSVATVQSVVTIIDQFVEDVSQAEIPMLYFQDPTELLRIFNELEKSNLLALRQCEELTLPAQQMVAGLEKARLHFKKELKFLREQLKELEDEILFEESRALECEQKAKAISFGLFRDLIVDKYTLNLYVYVEDCYEVCVAPNDSNLSLGMMMKGIEHKQESLMVSLDNLPNEIVVKAFQQCYREDAKVMKDAHEATKMVTQIENLMKTLRKSLEPMKEGKSGRKLLWRSEPPKEKMEIIEPLKPLTKEQLDYLYFFTDFCPAKDDQEIGKALCGSKASGF